MDHAVPFEGFETLFLIALGLNFTIFFWLEALFPFSKEQENRQIQHVIRNFGLWLLGFMLVNLVASIEPLDPQSNLLQLSFGLFYWIPLPSVLLMVIVSVVLIDLMSFLFHWLAHRVGWLWQIHAVHHSDIDLDLTTNLRFHPLEFLLANAWKVIGCLLLGIPLWLIAMREIIFIPFQLLQHANIAVPNRLEKVLATIVISPAVHKHHHSANRVEHDSNYGSGLILWDKLFGTFQQPKAPIPETVGVRGLQEERWQTVVGMLTTPFTYKPRTESSVDSMDNA